MSLVLSNKLENSDRISLTVRICSDGEREWLDRTGCCALVYHERGKWWSRPAQNADLSEHSSEQEALDKLLNQSLLELRIAGKMGK